MSENVTVPRELLVQIKRYMRCGEHSASRPHFVFVMTWVEEALASAAQTSPEPVAVYLVATGEVHEGQETYTRHEGAPPPLCDHERLYAAPIPEPASTAQKVCSECKHPIGSDACIHWVRLPEATSPEALAAFRGEPASTGGALTAEAIADLWDRNVGMPTAKYPLCALDIVCFARAIERAHGIAALPSDTGEAK